MINLFNSVLLPFGGEVTEYLSYEYGEGPVKTHRYIQMQYAIPCNDGINRIGQFSFDLPLGAAVVNMLGIFNQRVNSLHNAKQYSKV